MASSSNVSSCPDLGDSPHQPRNVVYPKVSFGKTKLVYRSFNATWYDKWPWLHWDASTERAFAIHVSLLTSKRSSEQIALIQLLYLEGIKTGRTLLVPFDSMRILAVTKSQLRSWSHYLPQLEM